MIRAVLTPMLLLAVLIQTAFGCFWHHSHEPAARSEVTPSVSAAPHHDGHGHSHGHRHGRHDHGLPPAAHFHFGGDGGEDHEHEQTGDDTYSYVVSRAVTLPPADFASVDFAAFGLPGDVRISAEPTGRRERSDAFGRSGWPSGQRLSLIGVWLI